VEGLISEKGEGVAEAKKRAELLQQEAKELLLQASGKLQILKGMTASHDCCYASSYKLIIHILYTVQTVYSTVQTVLLGHSHKRCCVKNMHVPMYVF